MRGASTRTRGRRGAVLTAAVALACFANFGIVPARAESGPASPLIVNGKSTSYAKWPYVAALLQAGVADPWAGQFCGASVVASTLVLTAAHCVTNAFGDPVSPGDIDVFVHADDLAFGEPGSARIDVVSIDVHSSWNPSARAHDLAILTLATPAGVPPVSIVPSQSDHRWAAGRTARSAGFGCSTFEVAPWPGFCTDYPVHLRDTSLPMVSDGACGGMYGGDFSKFTMVCAGEIGAVDPDTNEADGRSPCFGDSGGPLVVEGLGGVDLQVGVVSWGPPCGTGPGVFTRLATYRTWLAARGVPIQPPAFVGGPAIEVGAVGFEPIAGDFDGDGFDDVLWYRPGTGSDPIWWGRANGFAHGTNVDIDGHYLPIVGDFDGDGRDDVLWYTPGTGPDGLWYGNGSGSGFLRGARVNVDGTYVPIAGDFNNDGFDDIVWYRAGPGPDGFWTGGPTGFGRASAANNGTYQPVPGDFDGDGYDDIYWYRPGSGSEMLWRGGATGFDGDDARPLGDDFIGLPGDFDGDDKDDVFWYAAGAATDRLWRGTSGGFRGAPEVVVNGEYAGIAGDFNGDGRDDLVFYGSGAVRDVHWRGNPR